VFVLHSSSIAWILTRYAKDYQEPLLLERWLPRTDHDLLFGGVEEVYEFHKVLYQFIDSVLQSNVLDWKLGHSLLDFVCSCLELSMNASLMQCNARKKIPVYTEIYTRYASSLPKIVTLSAKYTSNPAMTAFLQVRAQLQPRASLLHLLALLHKPIQRKREMLKVIRRILGRTPEHHPDRDSLILAWRLARESLRVIETSMRRSEVSENVKDLEARLVDWKVCLVSPSLYSPLF
jgi:hypothetical protein